MAAAVGTAILSWVGVATTAEIAASTALTVAAYAVGGLAIGAAEVGLNYVEHAIQGGPSNPKSTVPGNSAKINTKLFESAV